MSRSCHRATFSSPTSALRAQHAGQAADALAHDRVALVRHRRASPSGPARTAPRLAHLGALQVADLQGEPLERGADAGDRREQRGVPVARDDLRRDRLAPSPSAPQRRAPRRAGRCWRRRRRRRRSCRRGRPSNAAASRVAPAAQLGRPSRAASGRTWSARRARRACGRCIGVCRNSSARASVARRRASMPASSSSPRRAAAARAPCRRRPRTSGRSGTSGPARPPARPPTP